MKVPNIRTFDCLIHEYISKYAIDHIPIPVNFRQLIPELNNVDRYSHSIHSYPAKLISHIPYFFLNGDFFCPKNGVVLDPFCGTGTVLLEAILNSKNALGADANPLARLITDTKVTFLDKEILTECLNNIIEKAQKINNPIIPNVGNIDLWFSKSSQKQLAQLIIVINNIVHNDIKRFFQTSFSNVIKKVSYADPRISVPVRLNPMRYEVGSEIYKKIQTKIKFLEEVDVFEKFRLICQDNITRIATLQTVAESGIKAKIISTDARKLTSDIDSNSLLAAESVDLILTSPPYAGAQKYIRSSSLNLSWLGLTLPDNIRSLDSRNIGREHYYKHEIRNIQTGIRQADILLEELFNSGKSERAYIVGNYLNEMKDALDESIRVLKPQGYLVLVIGNNKVCNLEFNTQEYLTDYLLHKDLSLQFKLIDDIKSYGLMTKRNQTADIISREWVLVFKK